MSYEKKVNQVECASKNRTIWVDLDNSPHVPFFSPIIKELGKKGYQVIISSRDCSQTCSLADLFSLNYKKIGKHYGKNKLVKVAGTIYRAGQLVRFIQKKRPALAISHGSRAQTLAAKLLGVPSVVLFDYEFTKGSFNPTWLMFPEVIFNPSSNRQKNNMLPYPGIKEDVYVPFFRPDPEIKDKLGIIVENVIVTIRPPATEAHYHNPEAERLFSASVNRLGLMEKVQVVILPRYESQREMFKKSWPDFIQSKRILIPDNVVNGLDILWNSDLVISGGGTMNREAAALGIPVYSIFRGKIGAVDHWLEEKGRLILIETVEDVHRKIKVEKRQINSIPDGKPSRALSAIIGHIENIINSNC